MRWWLILILLLVRLPNAFAYETIHTVRFEGNIRTPDETIVSTIISHAGSPLNREVIRRDIKALFKLGQFRDIEVEKRNTPQGIDLVYRFVEHPVISEVTFTGNRKIKDDDLQSEITVKTYRPLDEHDVSSSMVKIREAYAKKGYYLAEIDYHLEPLDSGDAKLIFEIREHQGVAVRRVNFMGNRVFTDDELRDVLRTKQKGAFSFATGSGKYDEAALAVDKALLTLHYLNHGYLKVKVLPGKVTISRDKRYIFVSFQVHEGKPYRLGTIDLRGDILTTREELVSLLKTKAGNLYHQGKLEEDVQALTDRYGDEAYAFANIIPETVADDETFTADITFHLEKGKRITIERINISGNTVTRDKVIRRELKVVENDRYSERFIRESRRKLMQLGFFEEVNFATPRGSRDDTVELNITVKERTTGSFNIGAGFSSVENFIFTTSIVKQNFLGYGTSGELGLEVSKRRQYYNLSVQHPYFLDTPWNVGFNIFRNAFLFSDFRRTATGGGVDVGRRFFESWSFNVGYRGEDVSISSFSFIVPQVFRQNANGLTSSVSLSVAHDTRNNRLLPTRGTLNMISGEVSGDKLGGDNDFFRTNYRSQFFVPVWKGIVLKAFGRLGHIKSLNDSPVPLFERFFLGGPNSLRGYFPNAVGPTLRIPSGPAGGDTNFVYGGDKLLLFIAELELPLVPAAGISIVSFYDAGNSFAEQEQYSLEHVRSDYGFGLRWNSPMGPLRFEWGIPLDQRPGEDGVVFNFTIGSFF